MFFQAKRDVCAKLTPAVGRWVHGLIDEAVWAELRGYQGQEQGREGNANVVISRAVEQVPLIFDSGRMA